MRIAIQRWLCPLACVQRAFSVNTAVQVVRRKRREVVEAVQNEKILASGRPLEPQLRTESRTEVNRRIDPYKIRPGAYKMVLPPEEEAKLTLVRAQVSSSCAYVRESSVWTAAGRGASCMRCNHMEPCPQVLQSLWWPLKSAAPGCCMVCFGTSGQHLILRGTLFAVVR